MPREHGKQLRNDTEESLFASTVHIPATTHPTPQPGNPDLWGWWGVPVVTAEGKRPDPSRTRKLSPPAPMVLRPTGRGRVGHRRNTRPPPHLSLPHKRGEDSHQEPPPLFRAPDTCRFPALSSRGTGGGTRNVVVGLRCSSHRRTAPAGARGQRCRRIRRRTPAPGSAAGLRRAQSIPGRQPSSSDRRVADGYSSACAGPWGARRPPPPWLPLQRPSRDAPRRLRRRPVLVVGPPVPAAHPLPRADRCPRRRVYVSPPGRGDVPRDELGQVGHHIGGGPAVRLRSAQPWETPVEAGAAGAEAGPAARASSKAT